jgi:hypothetical protein
MNQLLVNCKQRAGVLTVVAYHVTVGPLIASLQTCEIVTFANILAYTVCNFGLKNTDVCSPGSRCNITAVRLVRFCAYNSLCDPRNMRFLAAHRSC